MNMKEWELQLVNYFIKNFDKHRLARLSHSCILFVDKLFNVWYVLRSDYINLSLANYVHMDQAILWMKVSGYFL